MMMKLSRSLYSAATIRFAFVNNIRVWSHTMQNTPVQLSLLHFSTDNTERSNNNVTNKRSSTSEGNVVTPVQVGFYSLPSVKQIHIDKSVYEVNTMRGSGPGGQGTNSSSSKVQLKVDMNKLSSFFDSAVISALRSQEANRSITADGSTLIVTCHEHRSAHQNEQGALEKVKDMLYRASYIPPPPSEPIKLSSRVIEHHKVIRRKKSNYNRMRQNVRKGNW